MKGKVPSKKKNLALRLIFSYEGRDVSLVSWQSVEMVTPPSDPLGVQEGQAGFWFEMRDAEGRTLYRRVIQNPIKFAIEVRSDDPKLPYRWQKMSEPRGSFVLLMPALKQAYTLVLFSSPPEPEVAAEPAKEIARFSLTRYLKARE